MIEQFFSSHEYLRLILLLMLRLKNERQGWQVRTPAWTVDASSPHTLHKMLLLHRVRDCIMLLELEELPTDLAGEILQRQKINYRFLKKSPTYFKSEICFYKIQTMSATHPAILNILQHNLAVNQRELYCAYMNRDSLMRWLNQQSDTTELTCILFICHIHNEH